MLVKKGIEGWKKGIEGWKKGIEGWVCGMGFQCTFENKFISLGVPLG
jgi:hypothetical protein